MSSTFSLALHHRPLSDLSLQPGQDLRDYLLQDAAARLPMAGTLAPRMLFFGPGFVEEAALSDSDDPTILAAVFLARAKEGGRAFREGVAWIRGDLHAAVLEWADGSWWLAARPFTQRPDGIGVFVGEWRITEGEVDAEFPEVLLPWIDTGDVTLTGTQTETTSVPLKGLDIRVSLAEADGTLPDDPCAIGWVLGNALDAELVAEGLNALLIFAFRPGLVERWEVRGKLEMPLPDLIRSIALEGAPAEAMAFVHPAVVELPQGQHRAWVTVVERKGQKGVRCLPMERIEDRWEPLPPVYRMEGAVQPEEAWIGVEPVNRFSLRPRSPGFLGDQETPEG